jgi:hypothetical protein
MRERELLHTPEPTQNIDRENGNARKNSTMHSQSFSSCQYGSKSSLCFVPKIVR